MNKTTHIQKYNQNQNHLFINYKELSKKIIIWSIVKLNKIINSNKNNRLINLVRNQI